MPSAHVVDILMYHSISDGAGPTCIPLEIFRAQLEALQAQSYQPVSLSQVRSWQMQEGELPDRSFVLTFDDGFADFADVAFPVLQELGWSATVFLPVRHIGKIERWAGQLEPQRPLMGWPEVRRLARAGIEFGGHSLTHPDMTQLTAAELAIETRMPREVIQQQISGPAPISFAAPYGRINARVREEIRKHYQIAVGVQLARARRGSDRFDLPRIEMHYFRDIRVWRKFLKGNAKAYFLTRRVLRSARSVATSLVRRRTRNA